MECRDNDVQPYHYLVKVAGMSKQTVKTLLTVDAHSRSWYQARLKKDWSIPSQKISNMS